MTIRSPWLVRRPGQRPERRLYCFAYAGGNAGIFTSWRGAFEPAVEVCAIQLPGRGARMAETPLRDLSQVVEEIASAIAADSDLPFDFFGHSLGGLLAFEVARTFAARGLRQPDHLIVSGCEAPARRSRGKAVHLFSDAELIGELRALNGTPPEVLANRDLMALLLPVLRADFTLVYDYAYRPGLPLRMPVTVLAGSRDPRCQAENMQCWLDESSAGGALHWIDGDHFFIHAQQDAVLETVRQVLET